MVVHEQIPQLAINVEKALYDSRSETQVRYVDAQVALKFIRTYIKQGNSNGVLPTTLPKIHDISKLFDGGLHDENMTPDKLEKIHEISALVYQHIKPLVESDTNTKLDKWNALYLVTRKLRADCVGDGRDRYRKLRPDTRFPGHN